jgi:hypothetical protein
VFVAGFSLEAAESICTGEDVKTADVLDLLARLVDKSLVMVQPAASARYRLVEPLRQYAFQCLAARGETAELEERHTAYYLALAEQAARELRGPDQIVWLARLDRELDNLRATLEHAIARARAEHVPRHVLLTLVALERLAEVEGTSGDAARAADSRTMTAAYGRLSKLELHSRLQVAERLDRIPVGADGRQNGHSLAVL